MKNRWLYAIGGVGVLLGLGYFLFRGTDKGAEIEYTYAPISKGELILSTSSVGALVPLTRVDVRSKAGGRIDKLLVEEGTIVQAGDLMALIDPTDTQSLYSQAEADMRAAQARVSGAETALARERQDAETRVAQAESSLKLARLRLERSKTSATTQPGLTSSAIAAAEASLTTAKASLDQFDRVTRPQRLKDAEAAKTQAASSRLTAESEIKRQESLYEKGYVALAAVERARSAFDAARSSEATAVQRASTVEADLNSERRILEARIEQAEASLKQARLNKSEDVQTERAVREAEQAVAQAELSLKQARTDALQIKSRQADLQASSASAVRSKVAAENALENLRQTKVLAPRSGIVTKKYLEEGTIIPAAVSAFSQGTSLVELSDTTSMFVECRVDEADISAVKIGQKTRIIVEAYPGQFASGRVQRIFPAAETENAVTAIKVRVQIDAKDLAVKGRPFKPGMNATVEFLQLQKPGVLIVPAQAVQRDKDRTYVRVKTADEKKPEERDVKLGEAGNDGLEVLSGLKEGDEVVVAEINLAEMRERQEKMIKAQQGGGGLGSSTSPRGPSQSRAGGGAGAGGGGRPGGGGGGR